MTCVPSDPRFRLIDWLVGWDAEWSEALVGEEDDGGVRLPSGSGGIDAGALDPFMSPPRLSPGCGPCEWFLATQPAPRSQLLRLDSCDNDWAPWPRPCTPVQLERAVAVAVDRHMLAVADAGTDTVWILHMPGGQIAAEIDAADPVDLSFDGRGALVIASEGGRTLQRFTVNGRPLGPWPEDSPDGRIARIAHDRNGRLWLATEAGRGLYALWSQETTCDPDFQSRDLEALSEAFDRTDALGSNWQGFCLRRDAGDMTERTQCWSWFGRSIAPDCVDVSATESFGRQGQLLTGALDSGIRRCVWHRVRIEADVPPGTRIEVAIATSDVADLAEQPGNNPAPWDGFRRGRPHSEDWQNIKDGITDALITAPSGRYLFLRLRLSGDGTATPRVHSIRLDFPRSTSANLLPAVYLEDPHSEDFLDRFLALFDASFEAVDQSVARFPALLSGANARGEVLPWIAQFLSITLDESWDVETRRRILAAAPELFRQRGTRRGLQRSIQLAFGKDPVITEHGLQRAWGALNAPGDPDRDVTRLGAVRLFSRRAARMTLGASKLGRTPIKSYGNPDTDPHAAGAFRFSVTVPSMAEGAEARLTRLVEGQKPVHTVADLRIARTGRGFRLGGDTSLGIDTAFVRPAARALGDPALRLSSGIALGGHRPPAPVLGLTARVGTGPASF